MPPPQGSSSQSAPTAASSPAPSSQLASLVRPFLLSSITTPQILVESCEEDELVVIDWNYGPNDQELRYQLNFVTDLGAPIDPYDPIIINGGGGGKPTSCAAPFVRRFKSWREEWEKRKWQRI